MQLGNDTGDGPPVQQGGEPQLCSSAFLPKASLDAVLAELRRRGYVVVGPRLDQGAIVYGELGSTAELPIGWADEQSPGSYRLVRCSGEEWFGYTVGPHSWKNHLFPSVAAVLTATRKNGCWEFAEPQEPAPRFAFLGVRACELAAIAVQDRVFLGRAYEDPVYRRRREAAFIIAVNCTHAASTCFCTSTGTGPRCSSGFDLALTELEDGFVVEVASEAGAAVLAAGSPRPVAQEELDRAAAFRDRAVDEIQRRFDATDVREVLLANLDHPRWSEVATRCLSCTNCTMVCPTCFCNSVKEVRDLQGDHVERRREWDSCFNLDFSYMNSGVVRNDIRSRYRQWLTHKLATWHDQFGTSGCVGCGRCITWCPVGIDLTEEVAAIRESS